MLNLQKYNNYLFVLKSRCGLFLKHYCIKHFYKSRNSNECIFQDLIFKEINTLLKPNEIIGTIIY